MLHILEVSVSILLAEAIYPDRFVFRLSEQKLGIAEFRLLGYNAV
jgi:hypothetical protein